jgi:hypothetical protein
MDAKESINKLKEVIFLKKETGQSTGVEEKTVESLKEQLKQQDAEYKACMKAIEGKSEEIEKAEAKAHALKEKLADIIREWQSVALELFRMERQGEVAFDERNFLYPKVGKEKARGGFPKSIFIGSPRVMWVEDQLNPLAEDFRRELILDNRAYYGETRGRPRKVRRPANKGIKFDPDQVRVFIERAIPVPDWMMRAYEKYANEQMKTNPSWPK